MDFCETTSNTIIKTCAKFHFVMNLFQVIMTFDLTDTFLILTGKNASWKIHILSFCSKTGGLFQGVKLIYKVS